MLTTLRSCETNDFDATLPELYGLPINCVISSPKSAPDLVTGDGHFSPVMRKVYYLRPGAVERGSSDGDAEG